MKYIWRWKYLDKKKLKEWFKYQKIGKDTYIIMILAGILLFIIALPIKDTDEVQKKSNLSADINSSSILPITKAEDSNTENLNTENSDITQVQKENAMDEKNELEVYTQHLEEKLEKVLTAMDGVGSVKVMLTVSSSGEEIIEKDIPNSKSSTSEADADGGSRSINEYEGKESTVYLTDSAGNQIPYVVKRIEPSIEGIMVVAQGGGNAIVNKNITDAIQALFGVEAHKIVVVKMKS